MKKLMVLLVIVGILTICVSAGCKDTSTKQQNEYRAKVDYKQAYKLHCSQAIDNYKHLTIEELDYAIHLAFQQPLDIPIPKDLHTAYQQRHAQKYEQGMKEIKRLSKLSNEEFLRQVK